MPASSGWTAPALGLRREGRSRRTFRRVAITPPRSAAVSQPIEPPPDVGTATVLTVRRSQSRWPIGDPLTDGFSLCGCPAVRGAYCSGHAERAYRPLARRPPRDHLLKLAGLA
jgi:GcrA cell cycle regulator